jgi:radical SAM superfamily enzyme YgiQ (UPF0313 family)
VSSIILVRAPFTEKESGLPLGLAYVQGELKRAGHTVKTFDISLDVHRVAPFTCGDFDRNFVLPTGHKAHSFANSRLNDYCQHIIGMKPDIVGFSLAYSTTTFALKMARVLKKEGIRIIGGGPEATHNTSALLQSGLFHALVVGYGEEGVLAAVTQDGVIEQPLQKDKKYQPDYTDIDYSRYGGRFPVISSRGCPRSCSFCSQHLHYHMEDIPSVISQILKVPDGTALMLNDSNTNVNTKRTKELFKNIGMVIGKRTIHGFGFEVNKRYKEYINEYAKCNFVEARIGVESGSQEVRDEMNKVKFSNEDVKEMVKDLTSTGTNVWVQFILCYPSETDDDRKKTIELMHELHRINPSKVKMFWFRFIVHHGTEFIFKKRYGVTTPNGIRDWVSPNYNPGKIQQIAAQLKCKLPPSAELFL